jgi:hypothetical protein
VRTDGRRRRFDKVDKTGAVTLRYQGRFHHIGVGRAYRSPMSRDIRERPRQDSNLRRTV